jgi:hypothetical protein
VQFTQYNTTQALLMTHYNTLEIFKQGKIKKRCAGWFIFFRDGSNKKHFVQAPKHLLKPIQIQITSLIEKMQFT